MTTPRVFIIRHGETEWSLDGRHTGVSDIPLTANGERRIRATGRALVGEDRLIVPRNLAHVYVSPRKRAQRTVELLNLGCAEPLPWSDSHPENHEEVGARSNARVEVTESVREWDYGDYEGVTSATIREQRKEKGEAEWDIWRDGCPGGEYVGTDPSRFRIQRCPMHIKQLTHHLQIPLRHHRPLRLRHLRHPWPLPRPRDRQAQRQCERALRRAGSRTRALPTSLCRTLDRQEYRRQPESDPGSRRRGNAEL
jgi:broad specificity phosphatase PhoE